MDDNQNVEEDIATHDLMSIDCSEHVSEYEFMGEPKFRTPGARK